MYMRIEFIGHHRAFSQVINTSGYDPSFYISAGEAHVRVCNNETKIGVSPSVSTNTLSTV